VSDLWKLIASKSLWSCSPVRCEQLLKLSYNFCKGLSDCRDSKSLSNASSVNRQKANRMTKVFKFCNLFDDFTRLEM